MGRRVLAFGVLGLALAVVGLSGSSSQAAVHAWSVEELRIEPAEFERHQQALALDGMALEAAAGLSQRYEQDFNDLRDGRQIALDWLQSQALDGFGGMHARQDELVQAIMAGQRAVIRAWNERARGLGEGYFDELAAILSVERESVEALRRAHLRHRLRDLRSATSEPVAGVDSRLRDIMDGIVPRWRDDHELRSMVSAYEAALDVLLRRVDEACWTHGDRIRAAREELRNADERQREAALDRLEKLFAEYQEPLVSIRRLNMQTVQQLAAQLSPDEADALRAAVDPELRSYLFEHADAAHARLKLVLRRRDLTPPQRESLRAIAASLRAARAAASARLDRLYNRAVDPQMQAGQRRAHLAARWTGVRPPRETPEEQEFHAALQQWRETERAFNRQIAAAAGERWPFAESVDPTLIVERSDQSDEGSDEWIDEQCAPAINRAGMADFADSLMATQPELATAVRQRHAQLLAEYEAEANAERQRLHDRIAAIDAWDRLQHQDDQFAEAIEQTLRQHSKLTGQWHRRKMELQRHMLSELTSLMDVAAMPAWDRLVNDLRRKTFLPPSNANDGAIERPADLVRELERMNLGPVERERLAALVDGYATEIGALLVQYEDQQERMTEVAEALNEAMEEEDRLAVLPRYEAAYQERGKLMHRLDVATRRHVEIIAAAMEPDAAATFREHVLRHHWPCAFAASPTVWAAERLVNEGLLDEAQREAVTQLVATNRAVLTSLRQQIIAAAEQWTRPGEAERRQADIESLIAAGQQPWAVHESHPAFEALKRRMRQEEDDRARLRGLLRADQLELCPPGVQLVLETKP